MTTVKLYLGVLDGTGSRGCLDFELANSLEETLSCFDAIWAGCFVNGRFRSPVHHPSGRTCCSNSSIPEKVGYFDFIVKTTFCPSSLVVKANA